MKLYKTASLLYKAIELYNKTNEKSFSIKF